MNRTVRISAWLAWAIFVVLVVSAALHLHSSLSGLLCERPEETTAGSIHFKSSPVAVTEVSI